MIHITQYAAVLTELPGNLARADHARIRRCEAMPANRDMSPSAAYALQACALLGEHRPEALVTISGPVGSTLSAFDRAWHLASGRPMVSEGFGHKRARRIHPFTLLLSLQNQVPALISMRLGLRGPSLNFVDSATSLAYALYNMQYLLIDHSPLLLVMASAGYRAEDKSKHVRTYGRGRGIEGAIAFMVGPSQGLGSLRIEAQTTQESPSKDGPYAPVLQGGVSALQAICSGKPRSSWTLSDTCGHSTKLVWEAS